MLTVVLGVLAGPATAQASHIMGGELSLEVENDRLRGTLVYSEFGNCTQGTAGLARSVRFTAPNNAFTNRSLPTTHVRCIPGQKTMQGTFDLGIATDLGLPVQDGLYQAEYSDCCRIGGIQNASSSGSTSFRGQATRNGTALSSSPKFGSLPVTGVLIGAEYRQNINAFDPDTPLTYASQVGTATGPTYDVITVEPNGDIVIPASTTATFVNGQRYAFKVRVTDALGNYSERDVLLTVTNQNAAPSFQGLPGSVSLLAGETRTIDFTAVDPDTGQTVTIFANSLPPWVTFTTTPGNPAMGRLVISPPSGTEGTSATVSLDAIDNHGTVPLSASAALGITVVGPAQLEKEFEDTAFTGQPSTLTFTVNNTAGNPARQGWSFRDNLPAGLRVADPNGASTDCPGATIAAAAGGTTIDVSGNLNAGQASCTATVEVVADAPDSYENCGDDVTNLVGLDPPDCSTLTVADPQPPLQTCTPEQQRATERWWFFGTRAGIDFDTTGTDADPLLIQPSITSHEGTTVVTDTAGRLRFWSNGQTVFDANHKAMPNGTGLQGNSSATQTVAAFPAIGDPNKYFVIANSAEVSLGRLTYSVVDMSLNGGLGDVTATKNVALGAAATASEALTAVPNADGTGFWVLTYTPNSPNVLAYEFDSSGPVTGNPVVSAMPTDNYLGYGTLNASPDLSEIVALTPRVVGGSSTDPTRARLLGFDADTGEVWQKLEWALPAGTGTGRHGYSADFSPSGDYVYATKIFSTGRLYRYRVAGNTTGQAVKDSELNVGAIGTNGGQVKRAPDGRMYVANAGGSALSVVGDPDNATSDVGFSSGGFTLPSGAASRFGLPQVVTGCPPPVVSDLEVAKTADPTTLEIGDNVTYTLDVTNQGPDDSPAVTLTDQLPAGLEYVSDDSDCNVSALPTITCELGAMAIGGANSVEIVATVRSSASNSTIENTAEVSGPNVDPDPDDNEASAGIAIGPASDLALTKTANPTVVDPGDTVTYTLQATNNGPDAETDATIVDTLPANVSYVSDNGPCNTDLLPEITCELDAMPNGDVRTVEIVVTADVGDTFPTNTAAIGGAGTDTNPQNDTANAQVRVRPLADLAIEKTASPTVVDPEGSVTYTLTVTNNGPSDSPAVITDTLPAGVDHVSDDGDCDTTNPQQPTCSLSEIPSGESRTVQITVTVHDDVGNSTQTNTASVDGPLNDPDSDNDSDSADVFVTPVSDLSLTKSAPATVRAGQQLTYTLAYANAGPTASPAPTTITDTLPAGVEHLSDDGGCDTTNPQQISCEVGPVPANGGGTIEIVVTVDPSTRGEIENMAEIDGPNTDPDGDNDSDLATTAVSPPLTDLAITKEGSPAVVDIGEPVVYTLTVTNNGPDTSPSAQIIDTLPDGVNYASDDAGCVSAPPQLTCSLDSLANGASQTIHINGTVDPSATGTTQTNTAAVSGPGDDPESTNDTASADTLVPPLSDLRLSKTAPAGPFQPGEEIPYLFTVTNDGPTQSTETVVTDTLPEGLSYLSDDADCDASAAPEIRCELGTLASGESRSFTVTTRLDRLTGSSVTNAAMVSGENRDLDPDDNASTAAVVVEPAPPTSPPPPGPPSEASRCFFGQTVTILGTNRSDRIVGTPGRDVINGRRGKDTIIGLDGDDLICGGPGDDVIITGRGEDRVKGSTGDDTIRGNKGSDWLRGGPGDDRINGGRGRDRLMGNAGDDRLRGQRGNDMLLGGPGRDWGAGGRGRDKAFSLATVFGVRRCVRC